MITKDIVLIDRLRKRLPGGKTLPPKVLDEPVFARSRERIIFVLDRSGSMGRRDYRPNRLKAGGAAVEEFITVKIEMECHDIVGLVVFHEFSKVICEGSSLADAWMNILKKLSRIRPFDGTDIASGLVEAGKILARCQDDFRKRIVLLTDGHGGRPEPVAEDLKRRGIIIDVIGIGGSPAAVNEASLRKVASVIDGDCRYRFIADRASLIEHFRKIATDLVRTR